MGKVLRVLDFDLDIETLLLQAEEVKSDFLGKEYLVDLWCNGESQSDWRFVQDRFCGLITGQTSPLGIGKSFLLAHARIDGDHFFPVYATPIRRVTMADAIECYGAELIHKPYCYEVICD